MAVYSKPSSRTPRETTSAVLNRCYTDSPLFPTRSRSRINSRFVGMSSYPFRYLRAGAGEDMLETLKSIFACRQDGKIFSSITVNSATDKRKHRPPEAEDANKYS